MKHKTLLWPLQKDEQRLPAITGEEHEKGEGGQRDLSSFSLKKSAPVGIHNLGAQELESHKYWWISS